MPELGTRRLDAEDGASLVEVDRIGRDQSPFRLEFNPSHPAADETGYVKSPNIDPIIEMTNMREASRNYEANMNMFEAGRRMRGQMLDLLK